MGKYEAPRRKSFRDKIRYSLFPYPDEDAAEGSEEFKAEAPQPVSEETESVTDTVSAPDIADEEVTARRRKMILIGVCAGILTLLIGLIVGIIIFAGRDSDDGLILDNVYAGEINLGGMTQEEAKGALHLATDRTFSQKDMVVYLSEDMYFPLSPENTGATLNVDAVVQAAYKHGREGSDGDYQRAKKEASRTSYTVPLLPYLSLDLDYIRQTTEEYCDSVYSVLKESEITLKGERPAYNPENPNSPVTHQTLSIILGTPDFQVDAKDLYNRILDAYSMNLLELRYDAPDMVLPAAVTAAELFQKYCLPAQDAILDTNSYKIISESYGYGFDVADVQKQLDAASDGDKLEITLGFLAPSVYSKDLTERLYEDTLSEAQTSSDINDEDRNQNLKKACAAIDQYVINVGDTFSLNKVLGNLSKSNGYKDATISQYNGTVVGGGVSQVASALYCSALQAGLEVTQRHGHEYAPDFIDLGLDAFVDGKDHDLRIRNTGKSPVRISASAENHTVRIELQGINTQEQKIELRTSVVSMDDPLIVYTEIDANNPYGYQEGSILQEGTPGYKIAVYLEKRDRVSNDLVSSKQISTSEYKPTEQVVVQLVYTDPEPTPSETEPVDVPEMTGPLVPLE